MRGDLHSQDQFIGVYPVDMLPKTKVKQRPFCCIINSAPSSNQGEHWLAIYVDDTNRGEFFDSYGHAAEFYNHRLECFLKRNCNEHSYNLRELQSFWSETCGQFCLYWLLHRCRKIPTSKIIKQFSTNKLMNDYLVKSFIHKHFPWVFKIHENTFTRMLRNRQQCSHSRHRCSTR